MVCAPARSVVYEYRISTLLPDVFTSIGLKGFSTTHPLLDKEIYALKRWLAIRSSWPQAASEWLFLSRKGNPLPANSFIRLSRPQGTGRAATGDPPAHAAALLWLCVGEYGDRYPLDTGLSRASQYPPHRLVYRQQCGTLLWHLGQSRDKQRSSLINSLDATDGVVSRSVDKLKYS